MPGIISDLTSGISSAATGIKNKATSFLGSLDPSVNQLGVVATTDMPQYPPNYAAETTDTYFNENYSVLLCGKDETGRNVAIQASLPEHFSWHLASDWQPLLNNPSIASLFGVNSGIIGDIAKTVHAGLKFAGYSDYSAAATQQVWNSTTPIDLAFPFIFNASQSAVIDVMEPIRDLCMLVVPSEEGYLLKMPGPNVRGLLSSDGYQISLFVGSSIYFKNVLVTGVSPVFDVMTDENGNFISAQVDVSIRTTTILTKQDIINIFCTVPPPSGNNALPSDYNGSSSTIPKSSSPAPPAT